MVDTYVKPMQKYDYLLLKVLQKYPNLLIFTKSQEFVSYLCDYLKL